MLSLGLSTRLQYRERSRGKMWNLSTSSGMFQPPPILQLPRGPLLTRTGGEDRFGGGTLPHLRGSGNTVQPRWTASFGGAFLLAMILSAASIKANETDSTPGTLDHCEEPSMPLCNLNGRIPLRICSLAILLRRASTII